MLKCVAKIHFKVLINGYIRLINWSLIENKLIHGHKPPGCEKAVNTLEVCHPYLLCLNSALEH